MKPHNFFQLFPRKQNYSRELWGNPGSHGTAVAGIAAANGNDLTGMAPDATIYNYKVLATNRFLNSDDFDGALAIQQALEDGAHIANCSWGAGPAGDGTSREARACNAAWALGLTIVKSAGNQGPGASTLTTPADADGVIVVGATDREGGAVQDYSSRGPTSSGQSRPHLVAPGGAPERGIDSCLPQGGFGDCGHGTSFAAPHVSGMLALILEREPELTPEELRAKLLSICAAFDANDTNTHGAGLVSLARLLYPKSGSRAWGTSRAATLSSSESCTTPWAGTRAQCLVDPCPARDLAAGFLDRLFDREHVADECLLPRRDLLRP